MASGVRLKYEDVKKYIEDNGNGVILLSKEYRNNREKLEMQCPCGNVFYMSFDNFKKGKKKLNPFDLIDDFDYDFAESFEMDDYDTDEDYDDFSDAGLYRDDEID